MGHKPLNKCDQGIQGKVWLIIIIMFREMLFYHFFFTSHETETTQWDHPEMISLIEDIGIIFFFFFFAN